MSADNSAVRETVLVCACGDRHSTPSKTVQSQDNPALTTGIVAWSDFDSQREWLSAHRPHGGIHQSRDAS